MKILLRCQSGPASGALTKREYAAATAQPSEAQPGLAGLAPQPGPGGVILCSPHPFAVAAAQRLYPDRRIEVKTLYRDPRLQPPPLPWLKLSQRSWDRLALAWWSLGYGRGDEEHAAFRRRVVDASIRLTEVAKQSGEAVLVAGPSLLGRVALKLASIGWKGAFLRSFAWGEERELEYPDPLPPQT